MQESTTTTSLNGHEKCPYLSIRDFAKQYSTWTESSIRWLAVTHCGRVSCRTIIYISIARL